MTLVRWNPHKSLSRWENEFRNAWNNFDVSAWSDVLDNATSLDWVPDADILENKNGYTIYLELPGVSKEDLKIDLQEGLLTIRGEKKSSQEKQKEAHQRSERVYGAFYRTFRLPGGIDAEAVKAEFQNGVLSLEVPKAEAAKPHEIPIK